MATVRKKHLAFNNPGQLDFQTQTLMIVVYSYMFCVIRPSFEVVKEGRILHFVSGYRRLTLISMEYDMESPIVAEPFKISNLDLIKDIDNIIRWWRY